MPLMKCVACTLLLTRVRSVRPIRPPELSLHRRFQSPLVAAAAGDSFDKASPSIIHACIKLVTKQNLRVPPLRKIRFQLKLTCRYANMHQSLGKKTQLQVTHQPKTTACLCSPCCAISASRSKSSSGSVCSMKASIVTCDANRLSPV